MDNDCENGSTCLPEGDDAYTCDCEGTGFTGQRCETEIDECDPNPCKQGAACTDRIADYSCACPDEYAGKDCSLLTFEPVPSNFSVRDLSADGQVLVGTSGTTAAVYAGATLDNLGVYIGDTTSHAAAASDAGAVIVGQSENASKSTRRAVFWEDNTIVELPAPEGYPNCNASGVTPDGRTIVGSCVDVDYNNATVVRWVDRELEALGTPSGTSWCFDAIVSGDGKSIFASCSVGSYVQPMRWTEDDGAVLLVSTAMGCRMQGITPDGQTGAGWCSTGGNASSGFQWTASDGFELMSGSWLLKPTDPITSADDISADGQFIVGKTGNLGDGVRGVRWGADRTPTLITDVFDATNVTAPGWSLGAASEISADGKTLVGMGSFESSSRWWILRLK